MDQKSKFGMVTRKVFVPEHLWPILDSLYPKVKGCLVKMLRFRPKDSTKFYPEVPCIVSKGLINKYQSNKKLKSVKSIVIQISGDKGRQIKFDGEFIIIPGLFKKEKIAIDPIRPVKDRISSVEFKRVSGRWVMFYSYRTILEKTEFQNGVIGVDRNALGNVATIADTATGKVRKIGPDVSSWKENLKRRKSKLQKRKNYVILRKLNRKQSNRTRDINHKVSKEIVDYAAKHCKPIVLEDLKLGKKKRRKRNSFTRNCQKKSWAFYQLGQFIQYKASLRGIPVYNVSPYNTSKTCSKCGTINDIGASKSFHCSNCEHHDHRDANAAFNIGQKYLSDPLRTKVFNGSKFIWNRPDSSPDRLFHNEGAPTFASLAKTESLKSTDSVRVLSAGPTDGPQPGKHF
jgi:putative transposase